MSFYMSGYRYNGEDTCKCLGCGEQEQYINCADIEVYPRGGWPASEQTIVSPTYVSLFINVLLREVSNKEWDFLHCMKICVSIKLKVTSII